MTLYEIAFMCIPLGTLAAGIVIGRYVFPKRERYFIDSKAIIEALKAEKRPFPDSIQAIIDEE